MSKYRRILFVVTSVLIFGMAASSARADAILNFTQGANPGGTISYSGGLNPLVGTNIPIRFLDASGNINNAGSYAVTGATTFGLLNFSTGSFQSTSSTATQVSNTFNGGGFFSITGKVVAAGVTSIVTLLSGAFTTDVTISSSKTFLGTTKLNTVTGFGMDIKDPTLVSYFGLPASSIWLFSATTNSSGALPGDNDGNPTNGSTAFSFTANNASVLNLTDASAVPEPGSLLLLGSGLTALGAWIRRRRSTVVA